MARYVSDESMYQCKAPFCKLWFSDREGIKIAVGTLKMKTHISCPKCYQYPYEIASVAQVRHGATKASGFDYLVDAVVPNLDNV